MVGSVTLQIPLCGRRVSRARQEKAICRGKMKRAFLLPLILLAVIPFSHAQLWSGIVAPSRAVDWSNTSPGVVGGIPSSSWPVCANLSAGASSASINQAIASCPARQYVQLGAGTFNLSSGIVMKPNVVLRGSGPDSTFLIFTGGNSCGGEGGQVCFMDANGYFYGSTSVAPGAASSATFCGTGSSGSCNSTYTQGATTIQLSNVGSAGILNGQFIYLDQVNDKPSSCSSVKSGLLVADVSNSSDGCSLEAGSPGRCSAGAGGSSCNGTDRNLVQIVQVVSGCSSACKGSGPFAITITPGLYGKKWSSSQTPGAWWSSSNMQYAGLENLSINSQAVGTSTESAIYFNNAFNCWVSNVRSISPNRNHVWLWQSAHITVQNSYFFGTQNDASQSYGVESFIGSDNLVINNIFQQVTAPVMMGPSTGSVFAYNFSIHDTYYTAAWMQQAFSYRHDAGALFNLSEGNISSGYWEDVFHGTGGANTTFRNYAVGWESGKSESTVPIQFFSYNRMENVIGNVLGCNNTSSAFPGNCGAPYHKTYETENGVGQAASIFDLTAGNHESSTVVLSDPYVKTSIMRWGNYDVANAGVRWVATEVPSGLSDGYANPVPSSQDLPASFWTNRQPSWWSGPWPAIGPDVSGGNIPGVGGHAYLNAAAGCFLNTMSGPADGTGSVLSFNANNCYNGVTGGTPLPPSGLTATVK